MGSEEPVDTSRPHITPPLTPSPNPIHRRARPQRHDSVSRESETRSCTRECDRSHINPILTRTLPIDSPPFCPSEEHQNEESLSQPQKKRGVIEWPAQCPWFRRIKSRALRWHRPYAFPPKDITQTNDTTRGMLSRGGGRDVFSTKQRNLLTVSCGPSTSSPPIPSHPLNLIFKKNPTLQTPSNTLHRGCQHHTTPYSTIQYHTVPYSTIQYHTVPYSTIQYHTVPYSTIQYHTVPYNIWALFCTRITLTRHQHHTPPYLPEWR